MNDSEQLKHYDICEALGIFLSTAVLGVSIALSLIAGVG